MLKPSAACANTHTSVLPLCKHTHTCQSCLWARHTSQAKGRSWGANRRAQAGVSQARREGDVMCFEIQLLKPSPGAADMPDCASQRRLVETNFPGEAGLHFSLHRGSAHKAFPISKAKCYFGAALWKGMLKSCLITNISNFLVSFHQSTSWPFVG